jgi:RNA polymerase sigma factor (sigma-70 family)
LTQEAFAAAWQGIGDFNGKASFNTWLHQIAYRKLVDGVRKSERHKQAQQRLRREWVERPESSALQKIVRDEETKQLYEALQDLMAKTAMCLYCVTCRG